MKNEISFIIVNNFIIIIIVIIISFIKLFYNNALFLRFKILDP